MTMSKRDYLKRWMDQAIDSVEKAAGRLLRLRTAYEDGQPELMEHTDRLIAMCGMLQETLQQFRDAM